MNSRLTKPLSVMLAGIIQIAPMLRTALPAVASAPGAAMILRWVIGGVALMGYHAKSGASGLTTPSPATIGVPYFGTISYTGGHAGSVNSMTMTNTCLGSYVIAPGLTLTYSGGYTATISGTPTGSLGTAPITIKVWNGSSCNGNESDTRSTSLLIQNTNGSAAAPVMTILPQNTIAQVGTTVTIGGLASGNPTPGYYWKSGITTIPGATNNNLTFTNAQLTNAGLYSLYASNSQGTTLAACYVTMAQTPSSLQYLYTNYIIAGTPVLMTSFITNFPTATNTYQWQYENVSIPGQTNTSFSLTSAQAIPAKSGTYSVNLYSQSGTNVLVNNQAYDSYWQFGFVPVFTNQPSPVSVSPGANATFNVTMAGSSFATLLWYQNGTNLVATQTNLSTAYNPTTAGATTNLSLTLSNVTVASAGTYTVVATNFWGSTTSSPAALTVSSPLSVSAPQGVTNYAGKNVSLSVIATGTGPFAYQWQKGSSNLSNGGSLSGVTTNILSIAPAAVANSGNYQVIVTNSSGSVTSSVAAVSILPLPSFGLSLGAGGAVLSGLGGVVGSNYVVQVSTNLSDTNGWTPLKTNVVPGNGLISFTDTNPATAGQRFYRLQFP